ncbi:hypothetical protein [Undibacterium sp. TS12]|uniref:COG4648 family protein n=1 Tax=Undibacterium sp. TS12 TaxID=2908202 RepID=UPI001F4C6E3D|nr:hypothetical protein [Undibacterium sp. TS12]MCH8620678.1 hypothetical protein [Undibacterium sp. TS12]
MTVLAVILTVLYPLVIWFGQGQVEPRWLAGLLLLAAATRIPTFKVSRVARWSMVCALLLAACALWANALLPLKLYPVLVNAALLAVFGYSLLVPPSMVERFARLREPELPDAAITYTRRVTQVWCVFFIINGSIAFATALWATPAIWSLYTGVISYILMGLLFAIEYLVRLRFKRIHHV